MKKNGKLKGKLIKEASVIEFEQNETAETHTEEMAGKLDIGKIHCQLRRMKKNSNFSKDVILTAIPEYRSKVAFTFDREQFDSEQFTSSTPLRTGDRHSRKGSTKKRESSKSTEDGRGGLDESEQAQRRRISQSSEPSVEDHAGFIMFEAGLEDISIQVAKRRGYEDEDGFLSSSGAPMGRIEEAVKEMENKIKVEGKTEMKEEKEKEEEKEGMKKYLCLRAVPFSESV